MPRVVQVRAEVVVPRVPSFLRIVDGGDAFIDIADVPTEKLRELGRVWTDELIAHAQLRSRIPDRASSRIPKAAATRVG